jgi:NADPH2 dehydrogenase
MTDVTPEGRITEECLGLWNGAQEAGFARMADAVHAEGGAFGVQLSHAGRKSMLEGDVVAPSAVPFAPDRRVPRALEADEVAGLVDAFAAAAERAARAGVDVVELHAAHGYLMHQFLSPISNLREDAYGDRERFALDVVP